MGTIVGAGRCMGCGTAVLIYKGLPETKYCIEACRSYVRYRDGRLKRCSGRRRPNPFPRENIFWTSSDIILMCVCRLIDRMSWNSIARILGVRTQTAIFLGKELGLYRRGRRAA